MDTPKQFYARYDQDRTAAGLAEAEAQRAADAAQAADAAETASYNLMVSAFPEAVPYVEAFKRALDEQITLRESWLKEQIKDATFGVLLDGSRWSWKKTTRVDPPRPEPRVTEYRTLRHLKGGK